MKRAVIITPFYNYSYEVRIKYVEKFLIDRGYDVDILTSDFDHRNKIQYYINKNNLELLHVPSYQRNLSYARINSHRVFAKKALLKIEELAPNLIYCSAPPNFLFKYISQYKKRHHSVDLIYELGDLWPETLPLSGSIKMLASPALYVWKSIRNKNIGYANAIIYECKLFSDYVSNVHPDTYSEILYLTKEDYYNGTFQLTSITSRPLRFAYLGSINNIIDLDLIVDFMKRISKKCHSELIVIGGGESADRLFSLCDEAGVNYENHGIIYDENEKHRILSSCQFGFNVMKDSVAVGATMKSLEYFHEGLILINNIPADSESIVERYNCGFNISSKYDSVIEQIARLDDIEIYNMRINSRNAYEELFDSRTISSRLDVIFSKLGA